MDSILDLPEVKQLLNKDETKPLEMLKYGTNSESQYQQQNVATVNAPAPVQTPQFSKPWRSPVQPFQPAQEDHRERVMSVYSHPPRVEVDCVRGMEVDPKHITSRGVPACPVPISPDTYDKSVASSATGGRKRPYTEDKTECDSGESQNYVARGGGAAFITARDQLAFNQQKKLGNSSSNIGASERRDVRPLQSANYGTSKKSLGARRGFVPPVRKSHDDDTGDGESLLPYGRAEKGKEGTGSGDERLKNIEPKMVELIMNEIMDHGAPVMWEDIAGLEFAKTTIKEIVVWPMLRPDIFTGLRGPPKGILLFGPPGTGKTLIGKCIASQVKATFFSISASSLTSKWVGEGEKMVRALFAVARCHQPAVIFIDEIDSLLTQRSDTEHESSRRIKTEFLVQLDGATTSSDERILVIGATNRPHEIDEAARRRLVKRLFIPLPDTPARRQIILNLMKQQSHLLTEEGVSVLCAKTEGFSGADMANLCREAALYPVRDAATSIEHISLDEVRPVTLSDFELALQIIKPSVSNKDLELYIQWNRQFGCGNK